MLRLAAVLAPLLSVLGFALAIAFYVDDVEGAACLRVRTDQGVEYVDRTPYYPWDCAWESAASLCARLAGAVCAPLSILPPAAFAAHALALRAALRRGGGEEEAAPKALVDDANDLWRPASAVWFLACAAFMMLGARATRVARRRRAAGSRGTIEAPRRRSPSSPAPRRAPAVLVVRANAARRDDDAPAFVSPLLASPARALVVCAGVVGAGVVAARVN